MTTYGETCRGGSGSCAPTSKRRPASAPPVKAVAAAPVEIPRRGFDKKVREWTLRHNATQRKRQQALHEKEHNELQQCTFRPAINTKSQFYARRSRGCCLEPLAERLHHEADKREKLRDQVPVL